MSKSNQIVVATDKTLFLQGIKSIVENYNPNYKVHFAHNAAQLKQLTVVHDISLTVLDVELPDFFGNDLSLSQVHENFLADNKTILVTAFNKQLIYDLHKLELAGFVIYQSAVDDFTQAFDAAFSGRKFYAQPVIQVLIEMSMNRPKAQTKPHLHENLSDREMEVFMMVTQGKSAKEISDKLFISTHTVYTHRKNILKKLACNSAAELINYAYSQGLLEND